jgi:hypothetical protein
MNFHQKPISRETDTAPPFRYEPEYSRENPMRVAVVERLTALATASLFGSKRIFPRRFDRAFEKLIGDPSGAAVTPEHAIWYYGPALHLDVDPLKLEHRISDWVLGPRGPHWTGIAFLDSADWSGAISPLAKSPVHREMLEIVTSGGDPRNTRAYRTLMKAITLGRPSRRNNVTLASVDAVEAYLRYCRDLIKSTRKRGVVRHSESGPFHRLRMKHRDARPVVHDSTERDIGVAITEAGELIRHLGGKHRTAIAQALKLPTIPVEVRMVHTSWLLRQMERTGLPPHLALVEGIKQHAAQ